MPPRAAWHVVDERLDVYLRLARADGLDYAGYASAAMRAIARTSRE